MSAPAKIIQLKRAYRAGYMPRRVYRERLRVYMAEAYLEHEAALAELKKAA